MFSHSPSTPNNNDIDISVSEINQQDLDRLEREGYTFHQSKYHSNDQTIPTRLQFGSSELERLQSENSPTFDCASFGHVQHAALLSPPNSSGKSVGEKQREEIDPSLVSQLRLECQKLKETNQKLVEAVEENHKALSQSRRQAQEVNELRIKNSQLTAKINELEQQQDSFPTSPLADYSNKKNNQALQQAKVAIQQEWEVKFAEYRQLCQQEFSKKETQLQQEFESAYSNLQMAHETETCKLKYQLDQTQNQIANLERSLALARAETQEIRVKLAKEAEDRLSESTTSHQRSIDSLIARLTTEKQSEIAALRHKHRTELASIVERVKEQYAKIISSQQQEAKAKLQIQLEAHQKEIERLNAELAEKETLFVNALLPEGASSLVGKSKELEAEIARLRSALSEQRDKILQKVKRKFKEHLTFVKQTFLLERQRLEMEFERRMREKIEYLGTKYKMKLLQISHNKKSL